MAKPRPVRTVPEQIAELKTLLDENKKPSSLKKLVAAIEDLSTEERNSIEGLDLLEAQIEEYGEVSREGITSEEYGIEREEAWGVMAETLTELWWSEEERPEEAEGAPPPPEFTRFLPSGVLRAGTKPRAAPTKKAPAEEAPEPPLPPTIIVRPARGGFMRPFGCGEFIRAYLSGDPVHISGVLDRQGNSLALPDPARGAATDDIRAAYKGALQWQYAEDMAGVALGKGVVLSTEEALRRIPQRLTKMRSHSFYRYFHILKQLKWVEPTGEEEPSWDPRARPGYGGRPGARVEQTEEGYALVVVPQPRRFYRLAPAGTAASVRDWADPLVALYGYSQEFRRGTAPTLARAGTLPRQKAKGKLGR